MKLNLKKLEDGRHRFQVGLDPKAHELPQCGPIRGSLVADKTGTVVVVSGVLEFTARLDCSRCLNEFSQDIAQTLELCYSPGSDAAFTKDKTVELTPDALTSVQFRGTEIDLWPEIREAVLLALPLKPLCREDCPGLCPECGKDLNLGKCGCSRESTDPRWEKLLKLKQRSSGSKAL